MKKLKINRRQAIITGSVGAIGAMTNLSFTTFGSNSSDKLALLGGEKIRTKAWPEWPVWDETAEDTIVNMLNSWVLKGAWPQRVAQLHFW
jgi:hypothetical protein